MTEILRIKTITELHELIGYEKPKHPLVTVIDYSKVDFKITTPVKYYSDFYQISRKNDCPGTMRYGRNSYDFTEGTLIFTAPGQVIEVEEFDHTREIKGWGLYFHPDLIRRSNLGKIIHNYNFFSYEVNEALHVSDDERKTLQELIDKIKKEYSQNIDKHSQNLIIANIELLLNYSLRYYDRQFYTRTNLNKGIIARFEKVLSEYYKKENHLENGIPSVKFCAEKLNQSPTYLSDLLKKETDRNALDHIHNFVIEKAKMILLNSDKTVNEIAYDLGFDYPQHFNKLFKKRTGYTPAAFRKAV